jgi:hypothetical protein
VDLARRQWLYERLGAIASAMNQGNHIFARIAAVQLGLPALTGQSLLRLAEVAGRLKKANANWPDEPRDSHGRWTSEDGSSIRIPVIAPFTEECLQLINAAKARCINEYTIGGTYRGHAWMMNCVRSYVPEHCGY